MIYWASKAPADIVDYGASWGPFLSKLSDPPPTIASSVWSVLEGDVTIQAQVIDPDLRGGEVRIAGGTDGSEAIVRQQVTLSDGQSFHEDAFLRIRN